MPCGVPLSFDAEWRRIAPESRWPAPPPIAWREGRRGGLRSGATRGEGGGRGDGGRRGVRGRARSHLAEGDAVGLEVPALGEEAAGAAVGLGAVAAEAAHHLVADDGDAALLGGRDVRLQQLRRPRHRRDGGAPLRLDEEDADLVGVRVEVLAELGEQPRVELVDALALVAEEGGGHRVAHRVRQPLRRRAERRRAAGRGGGGAVVRRRAARELAPPAGHVELARVERLQAHVDGGVDGRRALRLQVDAPVVAVGHRQVALQRRDELVELRRHARRRVHRQRLRRLVLRERLHRAALDLEALREELGEVGAAEALAARAAEEADGAVLALELEPVLLVQHRHVLAQRVPARKVLVRRALRRRPASLLREPLDGAALVEYDRRRRAGRERHARRNCAAHCRVDWSQCAGHRRCGRSPKLVGGHVQSFELAALRSAQDRAFVERR